LTRAFGLIVLTTLLASPLSAQRAGEPSTPPQGTAGGAGTGSGQTEDRVRARFRTGARTGTNVNESQAEALTLTLSAVSQRPIQTWIRTAGAIDKAGKVIEAFVFGSDAAMIKAGQRVRAFPPSSKSSMYQAFVTRVLPRPGGAAVQVSLASSGRPNTSVYVMEIVAEQGPYLSVPNEAIIEEGDTHIVYTQQQPGQYVPKEVHTGIQGELYTQIVDGVKEGEQVVTFGSFFIDAEQKLKGSAQVSPSQQRQ
jgi:hypothetical protein